MEHLRWSHRPPLRSPVVIAAFEGWNDAGDAASGALRWFGDRWDAQTFAEIDPEDFYDFTTHRPEVRIDGDVRVIDWPATTFNSATLPDSERDVVLVLGVEPHLRWRTFCRAVLEVASTVEASMIVTLGALLAEVPHSRPVDVVGTAYDDGVVDRLGLTPSGYEGPTGIVGVLHTLCREAGLESASLWGTVPSYVPGAPCPKATLALVHKTARLLGEPIVTTDLEIAAAAYERQITEVVDDDEETQAYVAALEQHHDEQQAERQTSGDLVEQVERFLREQNG